MNEQQDSQGASVPSNGWKLGSLLTHTQDDYPGLGAWFGQIWEGDDVVARVYGSNHKQVSERASKLLSAPAAQQDASAAQAVTDEREAFEMWANSRGWNVRRTWADDRVYASSEVHRLWQAWQARAAIAAKEEP